MLLRFISPGRLNSAGARINRVGTVDGKDKSSDGSLSGRLLGSVSSERTGPGMRRETQLKLPKIWKRKEEQRGDRIGKVMRV